jgi:hypothetical protein
MEVFSFLIAFYFLFCYLYYISRRASLVALQGQLWQDIPTPERSGVFSRQGPMKYQELYRSEEKVVRTGWNHIVISDPAVIPVIHRVSSKFNKGSFPSYKCKEAMAGDDCTGPLIITLFVRDACFSGYWFSLTSAGGIPWQTSTQHFLFTESMCGSTIGQIPYLHLGYL